MKQPEPFGKYLLLGQVAVGGMAEIYKARYADPSMPQIDLAIKRILPSYTEDESFVTMFKDEGNIAIRLKHPNIVNIYEVGEVNNDWYITMEFIQGTDIRILSDACEKYHKRFTPTQIARIVCETAKALFYAHSCKADDGTPLNIVHRDCTPHNIMVSNTGQVKLMDFGIAKAASRATKTRVGTVKGKSSYMSPEQAKGRQLDGRSDMFTLGTVAWELLTGYRLFKAGSDFDILTKVLKADLIHPSDIDSNIPRQLGNIIMTTLERDRDMRFADCGKFADALENWINVEGDGSDARLGDVVLALSNKNGHQVSELPDYVPGLSLYDCEDGNFTPKANAMPSYGNQPAAPAPAPAPAAPPMSIPEAPPPAFPFPGYPDPMAVAPQNTKRVPTFYYIAFAALAIITIVMALFAINYGSEEVAEASSFTVPEATLTFKTRPVGATVTVNGEVVKDGKGNETVTPIYSQSAKLGEKYVVKFEKNGYEPVIIERDVFLLSQEIEAQLMTVEEAKVAKMDGFPDVVITTEPAGAIVVVNGVDKGKSPVTLHDVKFGTELSIEVSVDGKEYVKTKRVFSAARGGEPKMDIVLDKAETAVAAAAPTPAPTPAKTTPTKTATSGKSTATNKGKTSGTKTTAAATTKTGSGFGTISVKATPWATVSIDSVRVGTSPINKRKVKTGSHKVELALPPQKKQVSKTVTVKADQNVDVGYNFNTNKWM